MLIAIAANVGLPGAVSRTVWGMQQSSTAAAASPSPSPVATTAATINNFAFHPATITVRAGSTVTWTNKDSDVHTVKSVGAGGFASQALQTGDTFRHTFKTPGTYRYICSIHPYMHGTVIVTK